MVQRREFLPAKGRVARAVAAGGAVCVVWCGGGSGGRGGEAALL